MDNSEYKSRVAMHCAFTHMVEAIRTKRDDVRSGATGRITAAWRACYRYGLRIDEETFLQWHAPSEHRMIPLVSYGATGEALEELGLATASANRFLVDPVKFIEWCQEVGTRRLPKMLGVHITGRKDQDPGEWDTPAPGESDPADLALYLEMEAKSVRGRRKERRMRGLEDGSAGEISEDEVRIGGLSAHARAQRGKSKGARSVTLPDPLIPPAWLPFASAPATHYWLWKWGVTKDRLRAAIRTHAQWAVDYKEGFVDVRDMGATRWLYNSPHVPEALADLLCQSAATGDEVRFRKIMVGVMARCAGATPPGFDAFDDAMGYVKSKTSAMQERGMTLVVPLKQLEQWFQAAALKDE